MMPLDKKGALHYVLNVSFDNCEITHDAEDEYLGDDYDSK